MTRAIEDLLTAAMRDQVADLAPAPDLVARAAHRNQRRSRIRLAASISGVAGIAAAVAISLAVSSSPWPGQARPGRAQPLQPGRRPAQPAPPANCLIHRERGWSRP
jgi:hypothetical protein